MYDARAVNGIGKLYIAHPLRRRGPDRSADIVIVQIHILFTWWVVWKVLVDISSFFGEFGPMAPGHKRIPEGMLKRVLRAVDIAERLVPPTLLSLPFCEQGVEVETFATAG